MIMNDEQLFFIGSKDLKCGQDARARGKTARGVFPQVRHRYTMVCLVPNEPIASLG